MQHEPEIESAFYFDLALRTFLAIKSILQVREINQILPEISRYVS